MCVVCLCDANEHANITCSSGENSYWLMPGCSICNNNNNNINEDEKRKILSVIWKSTWKQIMSSDKRHYYMWISSILKLPSLTNRQLYSRLFSDKTFEILKIFCTPGIRKYEHKQHIFKPKQKQEKWRIRTRKKRNYTRTLTSRIFMSACRIWARN